MKKLERWKLNLYSIWFTQILSIMSFNLGMPFMVYYIQELGVHDPSQIKLLAGILSAGPALSLGIMAPVWGRLADKFGKKLMMIRAVTFGGIVMLALGLSTHVWQLVVLRLLQGVFTGTVTAAAALVASTVPENRLGYSLGFLASSTAIGSSVGPTLGGLMAEWLGYRYSFIIGSGIMFSSLLIVVFVIQDSNETSQSLQMLKNAHPLQKLWQKIQMRPFVIVFNKGKHTQTGSAAEKLATSEKKTATMAEPGNVMETTTTLASVDTTKTAVVTEESGSEQQTLTTETAVVTDASGSEHQTLTTKTAVVIEESGSEHQTLTTETAGKQQKTPSFVRSRWFVSAMLMLLVLRFSTSIFGPYMPILIQEKMNTLEGAAGTTGLVNGFISLMLAFSGLFLGRLADKYNRTTLLRIYAFVGFLLAIPLFFAGPIWVVALNYGIMMFFVGGIEPVLMGATTSRINRDQRGTLYGLTTLVGSIGWGLSPMLGGFLSIQFSLTAVLIAVPAFLFVEFILASTVGKNLSKKVHENETVSC